MVVLWALWPVFYRCRKKKIEEFTTRGILSSIGENNAIGKRRHAFELCRSHGTNVPSFFLRISREVYDCNQSYSVHLSTLNIYRGLRCDEMESYVHGAGLTAQAKIVDFGFVSVQDKIPMERADEVGALGSLRGRRGKIIKCRTILSPMWCCA